MVLDQAGIDAVVTVELAVFVEDVAGRVLAGLEDHVVACDVADVLAVDAQVFFVVGGVGLEETPGKGWEFPRLQPFLDQAADIIAEADILEISQNFGVLEQHSQLASFLLSESIPIALRSNQLMQMSVQQQNLPLVSCYFLGSISM